MSIPPKPSLTKKASGSPSRRHARQLALQLLFQGEFHQNRNQWISEFWSSRPVPPDEKDFANRIVEGVFTHRLELDAFINQYAVEWVVDRMPMVDRNILRWAIYELLWEHDIPARVTVNEAIELAKRFADDDAGKFINGVLDRILQVDPRLESKRAGLTTVKKTEPLPVSSPPSNPT